MGWGVGCECGGGGWVEGLWGGGVGRDLVHVQQAGLLRDGEVGCEGADARFDGRRQRGGDGVEVGGKGHHHLTKRESRGQESDQYSEQQQERRRAWPHGGG